MKGIIINAKRDGYALNQIDHTLTVSDLISALSEFDPDTPVFIGNDYQGGGWYTYGGISWEDFKDFEEYEEDEDDEEDDR